MTTSQPAIGARLRTPRAAAIAGVLFAGLLTTALTLIRLSIPTDPLDPVAWRNVDLGRITLALNLVPFSGIAFLWFMGVLRSRIDELEDRFFATVFLGSGLLFLAMLFTGAAATGAIILVQGGRFGGTKSEGGVALGRTLSYVIFNIYAVKMAAVFMFVTSTIAVRTRIAHRNIALLGYGLALFLLFGSGVTRWSVMVFPLWVLIISLYILLENFRRPHRVETATVQE